ncbi:GNAT family N-acetyltransferase, partial [Candidatus Neomarinimicrobiota bacterium]
MRIQHLQEQHRGWARTLLRERWGSPKLVTRGVLHHADELPGFIALESDQPVGLITYSLQNGDCEVVSLDSLVSGRGIGSSLVNAVAEEASQEGCRRVWLITTNDNTKALRFYQMIGFELVKVHRDAIKESRILKPEIPEKGMDNIPIRDEVELEMRPQQKANDRMR